MTVKIQYVSDLHLEFLDKNNLKHLFKTTLGADVLILAGDICAIAALESDYNKLYSFLENICPKYKYVIHIAGNHEYYVNTSIAVGKENTMAAVNKKLQELSKRFTNYRFLNRNMLILNINNKKYGFIGCTLWTYVSPNNKLNIQNSMNDYSSIYVEKKNKVVPFTVDDMQMLYKKNVSFIKNSIKEAKKENIPCVLITHHRPFCEENKDKYSEAYETNLTSIIKLPINAVIFGHCHKACNKIINGIPYFSNCLGYASEKTNFRNDATFEME